ncbi:hypothetical protein E4N95_11115 [Treponema denticola]|uniref:hypothetical protein n=1 Tax=Treponema denticola TaxID=158 RepID=UPI003D8B4143
MNTTKTLPQISFKTSQEFFDFLTDLAKSKKKTKKQIVEDAVTAYASEGKTITQEQSEQLIQLLSKSDILFKELQEVKTLIFQILKNQQS